MNRYDLAKGKKPDKKEILKDEVAFLTAAFERAAMPLPVNSKGKLALMDMWPFIESINQLLKAGQISPEAYNAISRMVTERTEKTRDAEPEVNYNDYMVSSCTTAQPSSSCSPSSNVAGNC